MAGRSREEVERELAEARARLAAEWPTDKPGFSMRDAPSERARDALQRVIRLQDELDALTDES